MGSVTLNEAQSNTLQPDVQYRGFTASPLLGLPQGLVVYVDGVRINEVFGDLVNWDLLPDSIISRINLMGAAKSAVRPKHAGWRAVSAGQERVR